MSRSNSKNKSHPFSPNTLAVTLTISTKIISLKAPLPCPSLTLLELIQSQLHHLTSKVAYFQTVNSDWITDYKLQSGVGWIRKDCHLRCVFRKRGEQLTGIQSYSILKCIGVGGFSKVYLARDKNDGTFYAAKFIEKGRIKDKQQLIQNQKRINESVAFPFLVHMKDFLETDLYFIMITDYCPGGELFNLQRRVVRFEEESAKKYFIEVLLAIQYLHSKGIIYRDLKPQNIMLDVKGHIKIADFGLAKQTTEKRYSFCGSLEYMCPEVLIRAGHSFEVDFYCLGALLFQMLVGCPPFYEPNSQDTKTKQRILYEEVSFPSDFPLSEEVKDLIRSMLEKDPKKRLGHFGGTKEIKCHPWIGWLNREQWLSRSIEMPYPVNLDNFNFDCKDITASANRMLTSIKAEIKSISNHKGTSSFSKKGEKLHSPYRDGKRSLSKQKRNLSTGKIKLTNSDDSFSRKKVVKSKSKDHFNSIKACYMSHSKINLSKFLRYPTEIGEIKFGSKSKDRKSYFKAETDIKENIPHRQRNMRKRKPKQELIFMQIKRN